MCDVTFPCHDDSWLYKSLFSYCLADYVNTQSLLQVSIISKTSLIIIYTNKVEKVKYLRQLQTTIIIIISLL